MAPSAEPATTPDTSSALAEQVPAEPADAPKTPAPWDGSVACTSNAGSYVVHYRPAPDPIPDNEPFGLEVWVLDDAGEAPQAGVELEVDAGMPAHGHGMNRVPRVEPSGEGHFLVTGMLFHMPGAWEMYFDVTRGARTERAQVDVVLE